MLGQGDINPLNVFGWRRVWSRPPHFTVIELPQLDKYTEKEVVSWILVNLTGRFYLLDNHIINKTHGYYESLGACLGFELPGDAGHFSLMQSSIPGLGQADDWAI